jgi:D-fructose 1,6-bisphosphatase (EC 3.1.3.11)/sedoheptulose 1,7-bisphosphatase (EC 3.1.3.37)
MSAETTETRFSHLSKEFLHVVEVAAVAAARTMGFGQRKQSDRAAVEAMREAMRTVRMNGRIVIGEGERDKAPMLYIGEGYRARIRNHGHSCFLCEIVIRSQFHTTYEPEA